MDLLHQVMMETWASNGLKIKAEKISMGSGRDSLVGWEAYMNEMERCGEWKCLEQEISEIGLELEAVVLDALFDELVLDFSSTTTP